MSNRGRILAARTLAVSGAVMAIGGFTGVALSTGYDRSLWTGGGIIALLLGTFFAAFVWLVIPRQPHNSLVWVMAISGFGSGLYLGGHAVAASMASNWELVLGDVVVPSLLPPAAAVLAAVSVGGVYVALLAWLCFGLLLFPDGHLPSPRWRWVAVMCVGGIVAMVVSTLWEYRWWSTAPVTENTVLVNVGAVAATLSGVLALAALLLRFRGSTGLARDQFKWVVWGAAILVPFFAAAFVVGGSEYEQVVLIPLHVAIALMLTAYGIAVGRYRLFDVDVVISRTVVYGTLAVGISTVYVAVVAGLGQLAGGTSNPNPVLALTTTAIIAVAFHPIRRRLERAANRLVYGRKATPYEVLSDFSKGVGAADTALLGQVTRSLVDGTGADHAALWVGVGDDEVEAARWPRDGAEGDGTVSDFPILHDGTVLGRLTLFSTPGQRLSEGDVRLVDEVVSGMGLALRNQLLTRTLQARVEDLRESRQRLVTVQDATRRKLERDLHDGAQQQLVALKVKLGLARSIAGAEGAADTKHMLEGLSDEADEAVNALREFARGVYPPVLEAEGLKTAIEAQARKSAVPVTVDADGVGRLAPDLEATIYFCVLEALQNAVHHADASSIRIGLALADGVLRFEVTDDGRGFDPASAGAGAGLINIEDRLGSAGGEFEIDSHPGGGTAVRGTIPLGATG